MGNQTEKRKELLQRIKEFCLFDDSFMSRVFDENIECNVRNWFCALYWTGRI